MNRIFPITFGLLTLLVSCQSPSPTIESANSYLKALKDNDAQTLSRTTCLTDPPEREPVATGITSWEFIEESLQASDYDPAGEYTEVIAEIEYTGIASPVKDLFILTVWKTDDLYESQLRSTERGNQLSRQTQETIRASRALLGDTIDIDSDAYEPSEPPDRDGLTSQEYCVTQLRRLDRP